MRLFFNLELSYLGCLFPSIFYLCNVLIRFAQLHLPLGLPSLFFWTFTLFGGFAHPDLHFLPHLHAELDLLRYGSFIPFFFFSAVIHLRLATSTLNPHLLAGGNLASSWSTSSTLGPSWLQGLFSSLLGGLLTRIFLSCSVLTLVCSTLSHLRGWLPSSSSSSRALFVWNWPFLLSILSIMDFFLGLRLFWASPLFRYHICLLASASAQGSSLLMYPGESAQSYSLSRYAFLLSTINYRLQAFSELESTHSSFSCPFGVTFLQFLNNSSQGTIHPHYPRVPCLRLLFRLSPLSHLYISLSHLPNSSYTIIELSRSLTCFLLSSASLTSCLYLAILCWLARSFYPNYSGCASLWWNSLYTIMFYSLGHLLTTLDHILIPPWDTNSFSPSVCSSGISFLCCLGSPL